MPRYRDVPSLQTICLKRISAHIISTAPRILSKISINKDPQLIGLQKSIKKLNKLLYSHVPFYLYDKMAVEILRSVKTLIEDTKKSYYPDTTMSTFLTEMNVAVSMTEVALSHHLRCLDFSQWPKIMRYVLYKNLHNLTGLQYLNLGSCSGGWRTTEFDRCLSDSLSKMNNLISLCLCFDSTDVIVQTISENCPNIQFLDLTSSGSVTDRSIQYLLKCKNLRELQLHRTSITAKGLAEIIAGLPNLQEIGRCDYFGDVIRHLHQNYSHKCPFALMRTQTRDISTENLRLLVQMFPKMEYVSVFHEENTDLTVLVSLDKLKHLKLLSCDYYGDYLNQLLELRGTNLTSLHLEHVEEMDFQVLVDIGQFCPQLKILVCYNCDFSNSMVPNKKFSSKPFLNLERIFWIVDNAISNLEFILFNAHNIRLIHLGSSTGITHSSVVNILSVNPMRHLEELRVLYSIDMSMKTVQLLLASCINLKVLSELEGWYGISKEELDSFRKSIKYNNFDLDIRPTLSIPA